MTADRPDIWTGGAGRPGYEWTERDEGEEEVVGQNGNGLRESV